MTDAETRSIKPQAPRRPSSHALVLGPDRVLKLEALDREILALCDHAAEAFVTPSLIESWVLDRCGYFQSFPHQLLQVVPPTAAADGPRELDAQRLYLTPAACLPLYPVLAGRNGLMDLVLTTLARVYRHESAHGDETRLWDYLVREFVFVGSAAFVEDALDRMAARAQALAVERLGERLAPRIVAAFDDFYSCRENLLKARFQMGLERKRELQVSVPAGELALASFNFHLDHFSAAFGFAGDDGKVVTGCAGFGLHRWLAVGTL